MDAAVAPLTLAGARVTLAPLALHHVDALADVGLAPEIWRFVPTPVATRDDMRAYVETALRWQREGSCVPFVTIDNDTGRIVGSTRFANIVEKDRRAEIGWTWITPAFQRSHVNTEAKWLMLRHAFETWRFNRVELKTSALNVKSRAAILRLGATQEGVFRRHMINADGTVRDTVWFSIIAEEWPAVGAALEARLRR